MHVLPKTGFAVITYPLVLGLNLVFAEGRIELEGEMRHRAFFYRIIRNIG